MSRLVVVLLVVFGLLLYLRSPIDLVPDRIGAPGLIDDLVALVAVSFWVWRQWSGASRPRPSPGSGPRGETSGSTRTSGNSERNPDFDPYRVLGVARGASREEITRAYREQMKLYHPDRVAELGDELRSVAHEKTLEIQRAYDALLPR